MIEKLAIEHADMAKKVLDVQIPAYLVEAELIQFHEIPPLKDTVSSLQQCGESFYGYFAQGELAGAISYTRDGALLDIHRMIVHPDHFRKGIAQALLSHVQQTETGVEKIVVSTGAANTPAKNLYEKNGFTVCGEIEIAPGVCLTLFEKYMDENR